MTDGTEQKRKATFLSALPPPLRGMLVVIALLAAMCVLFYGIVAMANYGEAKAVVSEGHGKYLELARQAGRECPAIAGRIPEFAGDGFVSIEELEIVKTLLDNERARPGGLKNCQFRLTWHA